MSFNTLLVLFLLFVSACQKSENKKKIDCTGMGYWSAGCPGYNPYTNPIGGGSGSGGATNPFEIIPSQNLFQNWGVQYPGGVPAGSCSATYSPPGVTLNPYDTRKATMAIQGKTFYSPASPIASQYLNTSSTLKSVSSAQSLFQTDSILKIRFKALPQPVNTQSSPYCYIPGYVKMSSIPGYTKLQFNLLLVGQRLNGTTETETLGTYEVGVNSCTPAIDLSSYVSTYPNGIYLIVQSVKGNQGVWPSDYYLNGFKNSNVFSDIRSMDCWLLDIEVAADSTKTFD